VFNRSAQGRAIALGLPSLCCHWDSALQPTATAVCVKVRDKKSVKTDGPFAETKEQLGGYYLIEAKDAQEASSIAVKIPGARYGCVEVRPIMTFS
jgi:hypothetical protein